jgi:type IV pilus assembly protein PilA
LSGQAEKAKAAAVKTQQTNVIKYIMFETKKCDLGETTAMDGNLNCSSLNVENPVPIVLIAAEKALKDKLKNPVNPSAPSICSAPSWSVCSKIYNSR